VKIEIVFKIEVEVEVEVALEVEVEVELEVVGVMRIYKTQISVVERGFFYY